MPTVPEIFAPSVNQGDMPMTPASSPWVSPMRNSAPGLLQQTGQTLDQTGAAETHLGNTIGDAIRTTVNDGMLKGAVTQFQKSVQSILTDPQSGYLFTRGMSAQTQWDPTAQAISKARLAQRATLTNPMQQRAYDLVTNDHLLAIGQQMATHQHEQVTQYGMQQNSDYADSQMILARDAYLQGRQDDYQQYFRNAKGAVLKVAELDGASPDSDVAQALLRAKSSDLVRGVTVGLLGNHQYAEAKQYLEAWQGNIDMRTSDMLTGAVKSEYDRNLTETKGDAFLAAAQNGGTVPYTYGPLATGSTVNPMRITDVPGSPRPDGRVHDGYDIAMGQGTPVTSPLDGKVVKVWNDDQFGGGLSMRVQLADGNTLGLAHLSATNVNEGDSVNKGQPIALSGKTGNATGGVLHVALHDPAGQPIDYFSASKMQPDQAGVADPNVLQRAIDLATGDSSLDPYQQKQVVRYMESQHMHERGIQEQQYQEVKGQIVDQLAQNGNNFDALPASLRAQLRPSDAQAFQDMQDQDKLAKSDLDTQIKFYSLPPEQRTPAFVKDNYQNLKPGTFVDLLKKADELQQNADNLPEAKVQDTMFRSALVDNNFTNLLYPKSDDDKQKALQLRENIDNLATSMQSALGRKLRPDEWQNVLDSQLKQQVFVEKGRLLPGLTVSAVMGADGVPTLLPRPYGRHYGVETPLAMVPQEQLGQTYVMSGGQKVYLADIPPAQKMQYELNRFRNGLPITEQGVADDWVHFGMPKK
jgi:murein DD-endopeptidase MepM/ murein hydrolase activator NlpD